MEGGGDLPSTPLSPPTSGNTTTEQVTAELATPGKQNISSGISSGNRGGRSVKTGAGGVLPASDGRDNVFDKPPLLPCEEVATVAMVPPGMGVDNGEGGGEAQPEVFQQTEKNVSYKYTREELMARYWGINMEQVKRVKALLRLGVDEDDLAIASKLLKLGRCVSMCYCDLAIASKLLKLGRCVSMCYCDLAIASKLLKLGRCVSMCYCDLAIASKLLKLGRCVSMCYCACAFML